MTRKKGRHQGSIRLNRCACVIPCLDNWACKVRDHTFPSLPLCLLFAQAISRARSTLSSTLSFRKIMWILQNFVPVRLLKFYKSSSRQPSLTAPQASSSPLLLPVCAVHLTTASCIIHHFPSEHRSQDGPLGSGRLVQISAVRSACFTHPGPYRKQRVPSNKGVSRV